MATPLVLQAGNVLAEIPGDGPGSGIVMLIGSGTIDDGSTGYAPGCLYLRQDGGIGTTLYVNEGNGESCDFNAK